jgi:ketosteroid isomerase-like protein
MPRARFVSLLAVFVCALAAALGVTALASQNRPVRSDQQILIQLERDWDAAFLRKDVRFVQNVLADDVVVTYPDGSRGDKAKELILLAEFDQQVDSSTLDEFTVKVNGDTAVVWFTRRLVGPNQGRRVEVTFRYIDVFVWRADRWQCIASQSTKVTPAVPNP